MSRTLLATPAFPGGATTGPPTTGAHKQFEVWPDSAGILWVCITGGTPGSWIAPSASGALSRTVAADTSQAATTSLGIIEDFEIGSGFAYELSSDALLEIT